MPQKDFQIWLSDSAYLVVDYETTDGNVVSFVVRLMLIQGDQLYRVLPSLERKMASLR